MTEFLHGCTSNEAGSELHGAYALILTGNPLDSNVLCRSSDAKQAVGMFLKAEEEGGTAIYGDKATNGHGHCVALRIMAGLVLEMCISQRAICSDISCQKGEGGPCRMMMQNKGFQIVP